jgi:hypothetical protein
MNHKPELLPLAFNQAKGIQSKISELNISKDMTQEAKDIIITKLATDKAITSGKPYTSHLSGMEWYVESLVEKSQLDKKALLQAQYDELLPANSSFDELVGMM